MDLDIPRLVWKDQQPAHCLSQWPVAVALARHLSQPFAAASGSCPTSFATHLSVHSVIYSPVQQNIYLALTCARDGSWSSDSSLVFSACEADI